MRARTPGAHYKDFQVIISKTVEIKITSANFNYFKELGYPLSPLGATKWGFKPYSIDVDIAHLKEGSNQKVECVCDKCGTPYSQKFCRNTDICYPCRKRDYMTGNTYGHANKDKVIPHMQGENHPRWNPDKKAYTAYDRKVRRLTNKLKQIWSTWENADKIGLCGVEGAYQLDHKVSIKYGFYNHIPAELIASINNLEIITWEDNRGKSGGNSLDLWNLLS